MANCEVDGALSYALNKIFHHDMASFIGNVTVGISWLCNPSVDARLFFPLPQRA